MLGFGELVIILGISSPGRARSDHCLGRVWPDAAQGQEEVAGDVDLDRRSQPAQQSDQVGILENGLDLREEQVEQVCKLVDYGGGQFGLEDKDREQPGHESVA